MNETAIFKELIWDNIIQKVLANLFKSIPLLGWGPIGMVITHYAFVFADQVFELVHTFVAVNHIVLRNKEHQKAYDKATIGLKLAYDAYGGNSNEYKVERKKRNEAMSKLIVFNIK